MVLIELFWAFFKIGLFTIGGGYASLPLIENEIVDVQAWITLQEYTDVVTISQITPGPIAINSATFVGTKVAGFAGAVSATIGVVTPSIIIALLLARMYYKYRNVDTLQGVLAGLRPAVVALIGAAGASLFVAALFQTGGVQVAGVTVNLVAIVLVIIAFTALRKYKVDSILVIFLSGLVAVALSFIGIL